jgi:hypothetical protein
LASADVLPQLNLEFPISIPFLRKTIRPEHKAIDDAAFILEKD